MKKVADRDPNGRAYYSGFNAPQASQLPFGNAQRVPTMYENGVLRDEYRLDATSARPDSPWLTGQLDLNNQMTMQNQDNAYSNMINNQQGGFNQLASSGGLSSGARERMVNSGNQDLQNAYTGIGNQSNQNMWDLRSQDYDNQMKADSFNINNNLSEINNQANWDLGMFNSSAQAYAAEQESKKIQDDLDEEEKNKKGFATDLTKDIPKFAWDDQFNTWTDKALGAKGTDWNIGKKKYW